MTATVDPPSARTPMVGPDGLTTTAWYRFLVGLWQRTGGRVDAISDLDEDTSSNETRIENLLVSLPGDGLTARALARVKQLEHAGFVAPDGEIARLKARAKQQEILNVIGY